MKSSLLELVLCAAAMAWSPQHPSSLSYIASRSLAMVSQEEKDGWVEWYVFVFVRLRYNVVITDQVLPVLTNVSRIQL